MNITEVTPGKLPARLFQSGWIDDPNKLVATVPAPFGIVSLAIDRGIDKAGTSDLVKQRTFLFDYFRDDSAQGVFTDGELQRMADFVLGFLKDGVNVLVHCIAGQSRSSYIIGAVLCTALGISGGEAVEILFNYRPGIKENMQQSFIQHLEALYPETAKTIPVDVAVDPSPALATAEAEVTAAKTTASK